MLMVPYFTSVALGFGLQVGVGTIYYERVGKGKISVLHRRLRRKMYWPPGAWRPLQEVLPLLVISFVCATVVTVNSWIAYWTTLAILYGDDWIHGGDDSWKKRWARLRNKIKWKWLPRVPVPVSAMKGVQLNDKRDPSLLSSSEA